MNTFKTSDFQLSCCLVSIGFKLDCLDRSNPKRIEFCFEQTDSLNQVVQSFWKNELTLSPIDLFNAQKFLKSQIYSSR